MVNLIGGLIFVGFSIVFFLYRKIAADIVVNALSGKFRESSVRKFVSVFVIAFAGSFFAISMLVLLSGLAEVL